MKNQWLSQATDRQFEKIEEYLKNKFTEITCKRAWISSKSVKLTILQVGIHLGTVILNDRKEWKMSYYSDGGYLEGLLGRWNTPEFWDVLEIFMRSSILRHPKKP